MIKTVFFALIYGIFVCQADELAKSQAPLQIRVSSEFLTTSFHSREHKLFKALKDIRIKQFDPLMTISIVPVDGDESNSHFTPHYTSDFLGVEAKNMVIKGEGQTIDGGKFTFKAPLPHLKLQYKHEIEKLGYYENLFLKKVTTHRDVYLRREDVYLNQWLPASNGPIELDYGHLFDAEINPKHITFKGIKATQTIRKDIAKLIK